MPHKLVISDHGFVLLDDQGHLSLAHNSIGLLVEDRRQGKRPVAFRYRDSSSPSGWGMTSDESTAANADPNYQGLYSRDGS